jgi:hypothetical protein
VYALRLLAATALALGAAAARADDPPKKPEVKEMQGISILGNQDAPKALVIVPWKSSEIGDARGITDSLDDSRRPVDKEVFMRELKYYEIREGAE